MAPVRVGQYPPPIQIMKQNLDGRYVEDRQIWQKLQKQNSEGSRGFQLSKADIYCGELKPDSDGFDEDEVELAISQSLATHHVNEIRTYRKENAPSPSPHHSGLGRDELQCVIDRCLVPDADMMFDVHDTEYYSALSEMYCSSESSEASSCTLISDMPPPFKVSAHYDGANSAEHGSKDVAFARDVDHHEERWTPDFHVDKNVEGGSGVDLECELLELLSANPKAIKGAQWYQSFEQNRPEMDASAFPKEADVLEARFPQNANQNKPFNFLGLETGIQTEILRYSLNVPFNGRDILPTYNQFSVQMIEEESGSFEDYDTAVFRTNHHIHDLASYILYGLNTFCFYSPDEADWWFERIAGNIRNLRKVYFELGAGLSTRFRVREIRYERLWFIFFCSKHFNAAVGNLKEMKINTRRWGPEFADPTIFGPRVDIMLKLLEIRGLSWAGVGRGVFMQAAEASVIRRAMMLKEGETDDTIERLKNIAMTYKEDAAGGRMGFYRFGRKSMAAH